MCVGTDQRRSSRHRTRGTAHPASPASEVGDPLEAILSTSSDGIAITRVEDGRVIEVNDALLRLGGWSRGEVIGRTIADLGVWARPAEFRSFTRLMKSGGAVSGREFTLRTRSGATRVARVSVRGVSFRDQVCLLAVIQDATEQRRAEDLLRASEERLRTLAASAPVGIFETDAAGNCRYVNERWCELAGMDPAAAMGSGWVAAIHPADRERVADRWYVAAQEGREFHLEYRFQRPDGLVTWLTGSATRVLDAAGKISGYIGTVTDITPAIEAQHHLAAEERFLDAVLEVAGSLVIVLDAKGSIVRFNRACERISGYAFAEVTGRPVWDVLVPAAERDEVRTIFLELRAGVFPGSHENHWVSRDGVQRLLAWSNTCLTDESGTVTHVIGTGIDITDQRRAADALRGIETVGRLLAKEGPTPAALDAVLRSLSEQMGYPHLAVYLHDASGLQLGGQLGYATLPEHLETGFGVVGRALRTGEPAFVPDVRADPDYHTGDPDVTSEIAVPLHADGRTLGVLNIESTEVSPLTESDLRLAQAVADRLSSALLLGREQQALADRARLFAALNEFARAANSILQSERLWPALIEAIGEVVPADIVALTTLDRATGRYLIRSVRGLSDSAVGAEVRPGEGAAGRAIASRTPVVLADLSRGEYAASIRELISADFLSTVAVPLIREGAVLGAITVARARSSRDFTELECEVLTLLGAQAALALANAHLLEEVSELAVRDALTGLYNRRHFDASLDLILARWRREREGRHLLAAIMFDLDHFGRFNKEHGHQAGDAVLRAFGGILKERFRSSDLVARFGGEEFVVIMEDCSAADAVTAAEEIRRGLEARVIAGPDGEQLRATVSAGCAALDPAEPTKEALLRAADVGLFMAKRGGRNRVVAT